LNQADGERVGEAVAARGPAQRERRIVLLAGIAQRLTEQLHHAEGVQLTLNGAEIDALLKALRDFGWQIERLFPHTPRRDLAVATITGWQARVLDPLPGIN